MNNTARICMFIAQGLGVGLVTHFFYSHCKKHSELSSHTHTHTHTHTVRQESEDR